MLIVNSDLATSMSQLNIHQANSSSLQQQRQAESQNPQYGLDAHAGEPLTAPTPTRASVGPHHAMWTPDVGIRFAPNADVPTSSGTTRPLNGPPQDGRWDPAKGLKFG
jgi:programmed cell death 6-interacting protein